MIEDALRRQTGLNKQYRRRRLIRSLHCLPLVQQFYTYHQLVKFAFQFQTLSTNLANSADDKLVIFFLFFFLENRIWHFMQTVSIFLFFFFQKTGFDVSCKLSPIWRQFAWNVKSCFLGKKNKKNTSISRLLKILSRVLSVKLSMTRS